MALTEVLGPTTEEDGVVHPSSAQPRICAAIRHARIAQGLSQEALARRMGLAQSHISRWESGREPRLDMIEEIEDALGIERGFLLLSAGYIEDPDIWPPATRGILYDDRLTAEYRQLMVTALGNAIRRSREEINERLERLAEGSGRPRAVGGAS